MQFKNSVYANVFWLILRMMNYWDCGNVKYLCCKMTAQSYQWQEIKEQCVIRDGNNGRCKFESAPSYLLRSISVSLLSQRLSSLQTPLPAF